MTVSEESSADGPPPASGAEPADPSSAARARAVSAIGALDVGMAVISERWTFTEINSATERLVGTPAADLVGRDLWTAFPGEFADAFTVVFRQVMRSREATSIEAFSPLLGRRLEARVLPHDGGGIVIYFLDVTARHEQDRRVVRDAERTELLSSLGPVLQSLRVGEIAEQVARLVVPYLGEWALVRVVVPGHDDADVGSWHVDPRRRADVAEFALLGRQAAGQLSVAQEALTTRRPVVLGNAWQELRSRMGPGAARDLLDDLRPGHGAVLPMIIDDRAVGVLGVFGSTPWTAEQQAIADQVTDRAALAVDHAMLFTRTQQARKEAEAASARLALLARVSDELASAEEPAQGVAELARLMVPQLADFAFVTVLDLDGRVSYAGYGCSDPAAEAACQQQVAWRLEESTESGDSEVMTALISTGEPFIVPKLDLSQAAQYTSVLPGFLNRVDCGSLAAFPLVGAGRSLGGFSLVNTSGRGSHTADEIATAREVARRATPVLEAAIAAQRTFRLAEDIQFSLLDVSAPARGIEVATRYRPAYEDREIGGDWYDVFALPDGATTITIGDVMGHDAHAIATMAQTRTAVRTNAWTLRHAPAEILMTTDQMLCALGERVLTTAFLAELSPRAVDGSVTVRWSNAGHPPPIAVPPREDARPVRAERNDPPLGVAPTLSRWNHTLEIAAGTTLVLYTDGLIERVGSDIDEGIERLCVLLDVLRDQPLQAMLDLMLEQMLADQTKADDVAVLAVRIAP